MTKLPSLPSTAGKCFLNWERNNQNGHTRCCVFCQDCPLVLVLKMFELCCDYRNFSEAKSRLLDFQKTLITVRKHQCAVSSAENSVVIVHNPQRDSSPPLWCSWETAAQRPLVVSRCSGWRARPPCCSSPCCSAAPPSTTSTGCCCSWPTSTSSSNPTVRSESPSKHKSEYIWSFNFFVLLYQNQIIFVFKLNKIRCFRRTTCSNNTTSSVPPRNV